MHFSLLMQLTALKPTSLRTIRLEKRLISSAAAERVESNAMLLFGKNKRGAASTDPRPTSPPADSVARL